VRASDASTLPAALTRTAGAHPAREAFVAPGERLTWTSLRLRALDAAAALGRAGVKRGDHVGILMGNGAAWIEAFYGCAIIGAVAVPLSTRFKQEELRDCLARADVSTLVFVDRFLAIDFVGMLQAIEPALTTGLPGAVLPRLRRVLMVGGGPSPAGVTPWTRALAEATDGDRAAAAGAQEAVSPDDPLLIQFTSGTTSFPKGVVLTHRNMMRNAAAVAERLGVRPDDRYFSIRPYYHVAGTTLSLLVSLVSGACLLTLPTFDVAEALRILDEERCTLTSGNDTIFLMLMGHPGFDPTRLHLRGGWAAAGPEVMQRIHDVMGVQEICYAYGLSEASPNVVMSSCHDPLPLRIAGLALPHPGVELRIVEPETGRPLASEQAGEIQVRGWNVMQGYYGQPDATAQAITTDGWLRTGDLGALTPDGRLRLVGRLKDIFRVGGENVSPAEVEEVLHGHPAVKLAQVVGVPDPRLVEVGAAYVVLKPSARATPEDLLAWCRERCAGFKVPRYLRIVESFDEIGMTGSSKVQKARLREHAIRDFDLGS
jgi:fatty-acyl-CoA synthase